MDWKKRQERARGALGRASLLVRNSVADASEPFGTGFWDDSNFDSFELNRQEAGISSDVNWDVMRRLLTPRSGWGDAWTGDEV